MGCRTSPQAEQIQTAVEFHCHYLLDQKYQSDQDLAQAAAWKTILVADAFRGENGKGHYDLFTHQGGGPMGAEWNSDGILFLTVLLPYQRQQLSEMRISLNGRPFDTSVSIETVEDKVLIHWEIAPGDWLANLRPIHKQDFLLLYKPLDIFRHRKAPNDALGEGRVLRVQFQFKLDGRTINLERAFHHANGE